MHCFVHLSLAGISRSPALAIAYVMRHLNISADDAYRYIKQRRPLISPNFNFLGQLHEYEKRLKLKSTANTVGIADPTPLSLPLDRRHRHRRLPDCFSHPKSTAAAEKSTRLATRPNVLDFNATRASPAQRLLSLSSTIANLSMRSSQDPVSLKSKLSRPNSITFRCLSSAIECPTLQWRSRHCHGSMDAKRARAQTKSANNPSLRETTDVTNTHFQDRRSQSKSAQITVSTGAETTSHASSGHCELSVK